MRRASLLLLAAFALLAAQAAAQSDAWVFAGGEPGVRVTIGGADVALAREPGGAIRVDPSAPLDISISLAPPPNATWEVRSVSVALLPNGPGSTAPDALTRRTNASATIPPGFTVVVNKSVDLSALQRVGAGTFLMQVEVRDANDAQLYVDEFYVRVPATPAALLTVQGATVTAMSAATGYGLWSLAKDARELRDAWARHRKKREQAKLDVLGRAETKLEDTLAHGGKPLASAVSLHREKDELERGLGPVRWAATGLGLGGVAMAWLQFLGYLALDISGLLITALEVSGGFLTLALVVNVLVKHARKKAAARAEAAATRTLDVQEGPKPEAQPEPQPPSTDAAQR